MTGPPAPIAMIVVTAVIVGTAIAVGGRFVLRGLPEPTLPGDADDVLRAEYAAKISYRSLARPRFLLGAASFGVLGMIVASIAAPQQTLGCWLVFSTVAVLLAAIDAATTWLPSGLIYRGWGAMTVTAAIAVITAGSDRWTLLITILGGAAIAGVGYLLLWRLTGGRAIAFGDVRLMPMVGAVAGTLGWPGLYWSILLGSVVGAVIGIVRLVLRRRGAFPYAPALVAGPYAAALLLRALP
ncbi:prepilin peptidase [Microlunatus soli]|uniref:Leader peptidase (Prepilin peptidase) / N-methyltransferase n=1 Tax=Microlunatus soli TaxID=630515 RepID=A0A1H1PM83_9ACTN|nr:A24 family peptidase [Microlunatus soli]SDS12402.1 leader peptidase (prepilin peptidase) / N-methyltransferase [Microlunatus soli]